MSGQTPSPAPVPVPVPVPASVKPKGDAAKRVNFISSGFASGVVTTGKPMSLADQKAKKAGGIF